MASGGGELVTASKRLCSWDSKEHVMRTSADFVGHDFLIQFLFSEVALGMFILTAMLLGPSAQTVLCRGISKS